jgi:hypothetical protein
MKFFKKTMLLIGMTLFLAAPLITVATPQSTYAVSSDKSCERSFLGIRPWFRGLAGRDAGDKCVVIGPGQELNGKKLDLSGFIWRIALNVVDILLAITAYVAFFFVLYGGFQFLTGGSNSGQIEKARKTILNAVIGLVISLGAVAIVNLIFGITKL